MSRAGGARSRGRNERGHPSSARRKAAEKETRYGISTARRRKGAAKSRTNRHPDRSVTMLEQGTVHGKNRWGKGINCPSSSRYAQKAHNKRSTEKKKQQQARRAAGNARQPQL